MTSEFILAKVVALGHDIEEEVVLDIHGTQLVCFATNMPSLQVGDARKVQLRLFTVSDVSLTAEEGSPEPEVRRLGRGYSYHVVGVLNETGISAGQVEFIDESLPSEYAYLIDTSVSITTDRIDVRFLED